MTPLPHPHSAATSSPADAAPGVSTTPGRPLRRARHITNIGDWIGGIALGIAFYGLLFLPLIFS